jgi:RNA polymerase sigma-70 factor, ECF subfamily
MSEHKRDEPRQARALALFRAQRERLFAIAYRMLGSVEDAEDLVQETFIRWARVDHETIDSAAAWLTTVVTRLALNELQSARKTREAYIGPWLPEPMLTLEQPSPSDRAELADSLSIAFLAVLERLTPRERAVFLLRDVFAYEYEEIARMLELSEANCRQILRRARARVKAKAPRFHADRGTHAILLESFARAVTSGDVDGVVQLLAGDAVLWADGGGQVRAAASRPIRGALRVARFLVGVTRKVPRDELAIATRMVNTFPALVASVGGVAQRVVSIDVRNGRIVGVYAMANPAKLNGMRQPRMIGE